MNQRKYVLRANTVEVAIYCSPNLETQAQAVLEKLVELAQRGLELKDGTKIQFGWSLLTLRSEEDILLVCEPDFNGDPLHQISRTLNTTLQILTEQVQFLQSIEEEGHTFYFNDFIIVQPGALSEKNIYLERSNTDMPEDSGWYIGKTEDADVQENDQHLYALRIYELLYQRPTLMRCLALPFGYLVIVNGTQIKAVFDPNGKDRWMPKRD